MKLIEGTGAHVLDTRKTTPGMRMLEKQAVKIGGGVNHRIGLFDMILLKDNHVDFAGGIENAIDRCHHYLNEKGLDLKIEIEVRNFDELQQVLDKGGVNRIMLDNFTVADTKKAVDIINHRLRWSRRVESPSTPFVVMLSRALISSALVRLRTASRVLT